MEDQYNMSDLRHLIANTATSSRPHHHPHHHHHHDLIFPDPHRHITNPDHNHNHSHNQYYDMMMMSVGGGVNTAASAVQQHYQLTHDMLPREFSEIHAVATTDNNSNTATTTATTTTSALETDNIGGGDGGTGRWPRQETLTLLEIRSCLDLKFKESIQKGPLWDEVSRIMYEEHGYQRSGKKCREKFENLYKYYKKTKEGKAGRQDGKHYRFFRQLEALYGSSDQASIREKQLNMLSPGNNFQFNPAIQTINNSNNNNNNSSLSLSNNSSYYDTSSSNEDKSDNNNSNKRRKRSWKVKIKDFIDSQMKKLMEKQELWLDKMMKTIEHREQERLFREEEWRKQELIRVEKEHKFWANERSWIEARDAALMEALHKLSSSSNRDGVDEEVLIGVANENYLMMKKRKENYYNSRSSANYDLCGYNNNNANHHNNQGLVINDGSSSSPSNSNVVGNNVQDQGCYRFFIGDGGGGGGGDGGGGDNQHNLWENYGVKLNNNGGGSSN